MAGKLIISIGLLAIIGIAVFFPHAAWQLQRWFAGSAQSDRDIQSVVTENQALKAELARLIPLAELLPEHRQSGLRLAEVFSRYPFSVRNNFIISAGEADGVRSGEPVFFATEPDSSSSVLVGVVQKVQEGTATVQTLFDPEFKVAVRIGVTGADALLVGGPEPKLSLIAKDATVQPGDVVVAASPELPLGVPLANIGILEPAEDQAFKNATLVFGYDIGSIRIVQVGSYVR